MRVTSDMWRRFVAEFLDHRDDSLHGCRSALEAALADEPEPDGGLRHATESAAKYLERLCAAEAKLAKVREWMERDDGLSHPDMCELESILESP